MAIKDEGLCEPPKETRVTRIYRVDWKWLDANRRTIVDKGRKRTETDAEVFHRLRASLLTAIGSIVPNLKEEKQIG